jgi:hypothetical protein
MNGDVLPPEPDGESDVALHNSYLALVSNYTDRPDLLIAEIEKHDPGFVKRMNEATEHNAKQLREARFHFGKRQAYVALAVSTIAAIALLSLVGVSVWKGQGFWQILALGLFYAITQGGSSGFARIIEAIGDLVRGKNGEDKDLD